MMTNMKTICRRFKNTLGISMILSAFILINVLVSVTARATHSADYDGLSVELQSAAGGHTELSDAYEPALLEAELAADRQQNTLESMEELQTERILINVTTQNVIEKRADISYLDTEEYSDETESDESMHTTTTHVTPTTTELLYELPTTTPAMRSISKEYARKGKKQEYELPTRSAVDYAEEEQEEEEVEDEDVMEVPQDPLHIQPTTEAADEHLEPYAMKYYGPEQKSTEEDVPMQDSLEVHSNKLPEYQQLPAVHAVLPRFNIDTIEHKLEPTAIAVVPDYRQPIVVQAAPGLPAFLVSLSNAAPTKSSYPMTATPAPLATQSPVTTASPLATTTTIISTTSRPVGKQGKQINIPTRRKLLPHEQLRNYVEDAYIRMPLAVIVDPTMESLQKTKALWREALQTNLNIKIVLVALNDSGEPSVYTFNNTQQFLAGLNSVKEHPSGNAFIGIMHAAELIPYDSAVFISTADVPQHIDLVQDAAITLLKKRIRLYLMWYGEQAASENETQEALGGILGEVALRSGGEILHIVGNDNSQEIEGSTLTIIADALRGSQQVDIPVDTTLSSLHVKIDAPMRSATLETPNGEEINLKKLVNFKSRFMESKHSNTRLDAYIPLGKLRKSTTFKLKTIPESKETEYQVFVRGELKADLFLENVIKRLHDYMGKESPPPKAKSMKTHEDMRFPADTEQEHERDEEPKNRIGGPKTEVETFSNEVIHHEVTHNKSIRAEIVNENANIQNARAYNLLQSGTTRIEIGVQSQLILTPGSPSQIYFEITNTRSESVAHNIQVTDERSWLQRLVPQQIVLRPSEKAVITLIVLAPANAAQGTNDRVTFTCHGGTGGSVSQPLNLKVYSQLEARDTNWPTINWEYGSRCDSIPENSANCAESFWSLDVTAQDWESGIKRLESTPEGLIYRNTYTVGSNDLLRATYISSCCEPKVTLLAYDVAGNQRSYTVNVRDIYLTPATITAIVLGVFLFILIIAIIVALIVWRNRRRKLMLNLPTYRSHSRHSRDT